MVLGISGAAYRLHGQFFLAQLMRISQESIRLRRVLRGPSFRHFRTSIFDPQAVTCTARPLFSVSTSTALGALREVLRDFEDFAEAYRSRV